MTEQQLAALTLAVVALYFLFFVVARWVQNARTAPDPWGADVDQQVRDPEATEVCHRCFTPQTATAHFCPHCGSAVGPTNNLMPYEYIFSIGEVLRAGVGERLRPCFFTMFGYFIFSCAYYTVMAPVYWFFLLRNLKRTVSAGS